MPSDSKDAGWEDFHADALARGEVRCPLGECDECDRLHPPEMVREARGKKR